MTNEGTQNAAKRSRRYAASINGERYFTVSEGPTFEGFTAQTGFDATTPFILIRNEDVPAADKRTILDSLLLTQVGLVASSDFGVAVVVDTVDRLAAGGTEVTPVNANPDKRDQSAVSRVYMNPTATAAGTTQKTVINLVDAANLSDILELAEDIVMGETGSILIYVFSNGGTAPTLKTSISHIEEQIDAHA